MKRLTYKIEKIFYSKKNQIIFVPYYIKKKFLGYDWAPLDYDDYGDAIKCDFTLYHNAPGSTVIAGYTLDQAITILKEMKRVNDIRAKAHDEEKYLLDADFNIIQGYSMTEVQKEIDRWHHFSNGAISDKYTLMILFIVTVAPEIRDEVRANIEPECVRTSKIMNMEESR